MDWNSSPWPVIRRSSTMPTRQPLLVGLPVEFLETRTDLIPDDMECDPTTKIFKYRDEKHLVKSGLDQTHIARRTTAADLVLQQKNSVMAIRRYEARASKDYQSRWVFEATSHWDWEKVIEDVQSAVQTYEDSADAKTMGSPMQKCGAAVKKCLRTFSHHARPMKSWLALVPDGDYGAILCGSLQAIFRAASKLGEIRDDLMNFIADIPETITTIKAYGEIYENESRLEEPILDFHIATLVALESALSWLNEKSSKKVFKALVKQDGFGSTLQSSFEDVKKQVLRLKDAIDVCLNRTVKNIDKNVDKSRLELAQHGQRLGDMEVNINELTKNVRLMVAMEMTKMLESNSRIPREKTGAKRLLEIEPGQTDDEDGDSAVNSAFPVSRLPKAIRREDLVRHVGDSCLALSETSIQEALDFTSRLPLEEQDRIIAITSSEHFKNLLVSDKSGVLLIQGNSGHTGALGSASVVAASLVASLSQLNVSAIHFFCGKHKTPGVGDPFVGPYGMMKALLQQVLAGYSTGRIPFLDQSVPKRALSSVHTMGHLFYRLVANEPSESTTFCVIDGISFFENSVCEEDTHTAIRQLLHAVSGANGCFKLLITSPTHSIYVPGYIKEAQTKASLHATILQMPRDIVHGRRQGVRPSIVGQSISDSAAQGIHHSD
ncbi:hypothetical protein MMC17_006893 [Xylographa soralifera]|nr:hypothetical protein [Xylographa soralifera]